jgi:hypothetical protein
MSESTFLSDAEIRRLTGSSVKAEQIRYLQQQGIRHWGPNLAGKIIVPRSAIDNPPAAVTLGAWSPDFTKLGV